MLRIKKNTVTTIIHAKLVRTTVVVANPKKDCTFPLMRPRVIFTTCVSGKTAKAAPCKALGMGKNVPHKKNMGVKKRNDGKLKKSMFGANAVKHIAMEANINPPKKARGITRKNSGLEIKPNAATTASTMVVLIVARVAPHKSSPATTSSTLTGVATMPSKVFWKYMRTNEANVHSKKAPFIIDIATSPGAMYTK